MKRQLKLIDSGTVLYTGLFGYFNWNLSNYFAFITFLGNSCSFQSAFLPDRMPAELVPFRFSKRSCKEDSALRFKAYLGLRLIWEPLLCMPAERTEQFHYVSLSRQLSALYCLLLKTLLFQLASADSCHFIGYCVRLTNSLGTNDESFSPCYCEIAVGRYVDSLVCRLRN